MFVHTRREKIGTEPFTVIQIRQIKKLIARKVMRKKKFWVKSTSQNNRETSRLSIIAEIRFKSNLFLSKYLQLLLFVTVRH